MKAIGNYIVIPGLILLAICYFKIVLIVAGLIVGLILLLISIASTSSIIWKRKEKRFRKENEGKYYVWYSSNKRLKETIEADLLPLMNIECDRVYNNKDKVESILTGGEVVYLRNESIALKFPILYKVGIDKIYAESFFEETYQYKRKRINKTEFDTKVIFKLNKLKNEQVKYKRRRS